MVANPSDHCPFCQGIDLLQDGYRKPIINAATVTLFYYCCACAHSWQLVAADARQPATVTLRPMKDRRRTARPATAPEQETSGERRA